MNHEKHDYLHSQTLKFQTLLNGQSSITLFLTESEYHENHDYISPTSPKQIFVNGKGTTEPKIKQELIPSEPKIKQESISSEPKIKQESIPSEPKIKQESIPSGNFYILNS